MSTKISQEELDKAYIEYENKKTTDYWNKMERAISTRKAKERQEFEKKYIKNKMEE